MNAGPLALLLVLLLALPADSDAAAKKSARPAASRPARRLELPAEGIVARATALDGTFYARFLGWSRWQIVRDRAGLRPGEELRVLAGDRVELQVPGRGALRTRGEVCLMVRAREILMDRGFADVRALGQAPLALVTPAGELEARGVRFSVEVRPGDGTTLVRVLSGVLRARAVGGFPETLAGTGMELVMKPGATPLTHRMRASLMRELERFSNTGPGPSRASVPAARSTTRGIGLGRRKEESAELKEPSKPPTLKKLDTGLELRDRMRGLRSPAERMRRWELELAQRASAEREELERALAARPDAKSMLADDVLYRKAWLEDRREKNLARGQMLASAERRRKLFDEGQARDELLAARREELLGRDLWLQTRQGVAETRAELARLEAEIDSVNNQLATLGSPPSDPARAEALSAQRAAAADRANRIKDRIQELIEVQ